MALTTKEKNILRAIICYGDIRLAQRMKNYSQKTDEECLIEINQYITQQASIFTQKRNKLDQEEALSINGDLPAILPEG